MRFFVNRKTQYVKKKMVVNIESAGNFVFVEVCVYVGVHVRIAIVIPSQVITAS